MSLITYNELVHLMDTRVIDNVRHDQINYV